MIPNYFITSLAATLNSQSNDTSIQFASIKTIDGQTLTTADFAKFGRGIVTIDPLNLSMVEFASFTVVDPSLGSNGGVTGVLRGLSFKGNNQITANQKFHPVGTPILIAWGTQNISDVMDYINSFNLDTGAVNTLTITPSPAVVSYEAGRKYSIIVAVTNTGATTLNINGLGAKNVLKNATSPLTAGDITAGQIIQVEYDGNSFQLLGSGLSFVSHDASMSGLGTPASPLTISGGGNLGIGTKIAVDTTRHTITASTNVTAYTVVIPGGTLGTNNGFKFKILSSQLGDKTYSTITAKYGNNLTMSIILQGYVTNDAGFIEGIILANGATNAQKGQFTSFGGNSLSTNTLISSSYVAGTTDSDTNQNLVISVNSGASNYNIVLEAIEVETINPFSSILGGGGTKVAIDTTEQHITDTATHHIYTCAIPAGTLGTNNGIRFKLFGTSGFTNASISVLYGGSTLLTQSLSSGASANSGDFELNGTILANGATNSQKADLQFISSYQNGFILPHGQVTYGTGAVDSTVAQNLVIQVTLSGTYTDMDFQCFVVEAINVVGVITGLRVDSYDTTPGFLNPKLNVHSSDSSVTVTKTITSPGGNEALDIDLKNNISAGFIGTDTWMGAGVQTHDGIVSLQLTDSGGYSSSVLITDTTVNQVLVAFTRGNGTGANSPSYSGTSFPVKKGNTITIAVSGGGGTNAGTIYKFN